MPPALSYSLGPGLPSPGAPSFLRHSFVQTNINRDRISNLLSISYAFRPRLRPRLTLGGSTFPRKPWTSGECDSHTLRVTHAGILTSMQSTSPRQADFSPHGTLPYRFGFFIQSPSFGVMLSPRYFRRNNPRPVSYYALFKGWLLLSQPPGCPGIITSLPHSACLRDLSCGSGLFPSRLRNFSPAVSLLYS